ncbi:hypothetical protein QJU89_05165 [Pasteurella skyensis]|uniref:Prepilin peptidase dependent protein B n=1 Tax=Phocoenobacter skyensis TaxID=97481 RepID=A0AAJ6NB64_9PAST|nr:hypothetical protein [Pasteurella skyensis]MDP8162683.1 hypothetical protein [Pasteurella skyensis]MDP8173451.1 hypothetical protein [Pasteurella skyensis]MDP8177630.1 hypothetical protein [Pasteurella skyensis]MDP8178785.1 hypothetical protein [Pasteurella skyensis]MDP8183085.1 hypothetical protein [Pasteurella skyensis]
MLFQKTRLADVAIVKSFKAVTLVEILISLSLTTVLLFSFASFYSSSHQNQNKLKTRLELQQNTQQIINFFKQHIQHLYYQGINREQSNYTLFQNNQLSVNILPHCLLFFYDINSDGCVGNRKKNSACATKKQNKTNQIAKEVFGFKVKNQEIYIYEDSRINKCLLPKCKQLLTSCDQGEWGKLTENSNYKVSILNFTWLKEHKIMQVSLSLKKNGETYSSQSYIYIFNDYDKTI